MCFISPAAGTAWDEQKDGIFSSAGSSSQHVRVDESAQPAGTQTSSTQTLRKKMEQFLLKANQQLKTDIWHDVCFMLLQKSILLHCSQLKQFFS